MQSSAKEAERLINKKLPVMEVFGPTIQGEGSVIGQQTFFIRFGLCDYSCTMCDSMHAVDPVLVHKNAEWLTQTEIFERLEHHRSLTGSPTEWVTFSGGNPCIHDLYHLCSSLSRGKPWKIAVETQGTFAPGWLHLVDVLTVSPKAPGMGEMFEADKFTMFLQKFGDHSGLAIKIVVFDYRDLDFAAEVFKMAKDFTSPHRFYLSQGNKRPNAHLDGAELTGDLRQEYLDLYKYIRQHPILSNVKFLPQWHVWLWGNRKGV